MEDEEILQLISDQRAGGKNDTQIGRVLRMRGVSDVDSYLKKKDDTSTSDSSSGEAGTASPQATAPQGAQELGSSASPVVPQAESNIGTQVDGLNDPSINRLTGQVTAWTDTPANRARLEIDPVHYDAFQKAGFAQVMQGISPEFITPEIQTSFSKFCNAGSVVVECSRWQRAVGGRAIG